MEYNLKFGQVEENIKKQYANSGRQLPEKFAKAPRLLEALSFYMTGWSDLSSDRPVFVDGSIGFIPWSSMIKYAEYCGLSKMDTEKFIYYIKALDEVYVKHIRQKIQQASKQPQKKR